MLALHDNRFSNYSVSLELYPILAISHVVNLISHIIIPRLTVPFDAGAVNVV